MARDVESLVLQMSADLRRFDRSMSAMRATADKRLNEVEKRAKAADRKLSKTMGDAGRNMVGSFQNSLRGLAPTLAAAFSAQQVIRYADSYTSLQNRLKATGLEGARLVTIENALFEAANRNGVAIDAVAQLYQRASLSRDQLGASDEQLIALTNGVSAALRVQGVSAEQASGPLLQLGQALGAGTVRAEELNSLLEGTPIILQAAANGSARFQGNMQALTAAVRDGKVSSQELFAALLAGLPALEQSAAALPKTVGQALQVLNNELGRYIGQTDAGLSASQRLAQGIEALANNLDTIVLLVGVLATVMGAKYVMALTASTGAMIAGTLESVRYQAALAGLAARGAGVTTTTITATGATVAFTGAQTASSTATVIATGAMARFNAMIAANPIGAVVVATAALSAAIIYLGDRLAITGEASREVARANTALEKATAAYSEAARAAAIATGEESRVARQNAEEKRAQAIATRDAAQAKLADAAATVAQIQAEAQRQLDLERRAPIRGDRPGSVQTIGRAERQRLANAQASASQSAAAIASANAAIAEADAALRRPPPPAAAAATSAGRPRGGGGTGGATPEDLARQRQLLDLQAEIAALRAQDRGAEADARQDAVDVLNLTKQYDEAGFANAQAKAEAQVATLAAAREAARLADEAARQAEGEARALDMMRGFALEMLGVQEEIALTDRDALEVRRQILAIRQAERRAALETAASDIEATDAERGAANAALAGLGGLESGESRALEGSSEGARMAQGIVGSLNPYANAVEQAAEAYAEIDRLRQEDVISEQEAQLAKAQIDNDLREQRLVGTRTMLDSLASLQGSSNKKLAALGKAAAIAQATIDGVLAVQKALASAPPPFNFIQAAIVGAVAAANVASIAGMADGGMVTGPGGSREDRVLRRLSPGEFVVNARSTAQNRDLLEQINGGRVPGLASGGMVGRASAAAASVSSVSRSSQSAVTFAPVIDARGADLAAITRLEAVVNEQQRNFAASVKGVMAHRAKWKVGSR